MFSVCRLWTKASRVVPSRILHSVGSSTTTGRTWPQGL